MPLSGPLCRTSMRGNAFPEEILIYFVQRQLFLPSTDLLGVAHISHDPAFLTRLLSVSCCSLSGIHISKSRVATAACRNCCLCLSLCLSLCLGCCWCPWCPWCLWCRCVFDWSKTCEDRAALVELRGAAAAEPDRAHRLHGADLQRDRLPLAEIHAMASVCSMHGGSKCRDNNGGCQVASCVSVCGVFSNSLLSDERETVGEVSLSACR